MTYSIYKKNEDNTLKDKKTIDPPTHHYTKRYASIVKREDGYHVISEHKDEKGHHKNLGGPYKTKEEAEKRLKAVEYFKHNS